MHARQGMLFYLWSNTMVYGPASFIVLLFVGLLIVVGVLIISAEQSSRRRSSALPPGRDSGQPDGARPVGGGPPLTCVSCGRQNPGRARYCAQCGTELPRDSA